MAHPYVSQHITPEPPARLVMGANVCPFCGVEYGGHTNLVSARTMLCTDPIPKCRHRDGTADCPPTCLLLFGDRFVTMPADRGWFDVDESGQR